MLPTAYVTGAVLCLVSVIFCLLAGSILVLYSTANKPGLYLGLSFLCLGYAFTIAGLTYSRLIIHVPHLYRTGNICWLLCMPFSWLYIRTTITQKPLSRWDILHLLPLALYLVDYSPFLVSSATEKVAMIEVDTLNLERLIGYRQGWILPANAQVPLRTLQTLFYWILQVRLLASPQASSLRRDEACLRWMILYNTLQLPLFLPNLFVLLTGHKAVVWASTIPPVTSGLASAISLFLYPRILYGSRRMTDILAQIKTKPTPDHIYLQRLSAQLEKFMREEKPFLDPDYTLRQLAEAIGVPLYKLSAYLNQTTGTNFSDFLNQWRIRYCLDLIHEKKLHNLNLNGIAGKCGFNNRNTFSSAFKKVTGQAPSVYLHSNN
jgi:AraC-like DNA-binding protein